MKITNWRKKLATSLVACGLLAPSRARAADVDVNLVVDPGFENVDTNVTCCFGAVKLNSWADGSQPGFVYNYNLNYDNGGPLAGGGTYYFTTNGDGDLDDPEGNDLNILGPGQVAQNIAVGTGATGALIASGEAAVRLRGYFSSYLDNLDYGTLQVDFLNSGGSSLGSVQIDNSDDTSTWLQISGVAPLPVGTATLRASVFGTPFSGGPDGYIDNVDVQVTSAANFLLFAEVNTATGQVSIKNLTGEAAPIDYYEITSASGALNRAAWNSLQDQNLPGFPAGNGSGNGWEEGGGGGNRGLSESHLTGAGLVNDDATLSLGAAFTVGGTRDLVFRYGVVGASAMQADFDADGDVDGSDFLRWQRGLGTGNTLGQGDADGDADVDDDDLAIWKAEFGGGAFGGPSTLTAGFIRYVTPGAATVPEPGSAILAGLGLAAVALGRRREDGDS